MNRILLAVLIVAIIGLFTIPIGKWFVDDRYIYNVKNIAEVVPSNSEMWLYARTSTGKDLSLFEYWLVKRRGFLYEKIVD